MSSGVWQFAVIVATALLVASCGLQGDLYLEEPPATATPADLAKPETGGESEDETTDPDAAEPAVTAP